MPQDRPPRIRAVLDALVGERSSGRHILRKPGREHKGSARFLRCLAEGELEHAAHLLRVTPALARVQDRNGWTPLFYAVAWRSPSFVECLIVTGDADVDHQDATGWSPVMEAARRGELGSLAVLIAHGAGLSQQSPSGWSALHEAVAQAHLGAIRLLIAGGADRTLVTEAGQRPADLLETLPYPDSLLDGMRYLLTRWSPEADAQ